MLSACGVEAHGKCHCVEVLGKSLSNSTLASVHPAVMGTWCNESKVGSICCRLHSVRHNSGGKGRDDSDRPLNTVM